MTSQATSRPFMFVVGMLFVLHGLGHAAAGMAAQDAPRGLGLTLGPRSSVVLATALFAIATSGFVAAGFGRWGIVGLARWWRILACAGAVASGLLLVLFARPVIETTFGLMLDAAAILITGMHLGARTLRPTQADGRSS